MCMSCYKEYGSPAIVNDATKSAAELIARVFEFSDVGGNCHIVIDDFNLEDSAIEFCLKEENRRHAFGGQQQFDAERACMEALLKMPLAERVSALAIHDGFLEVGSGNATA